MENNQRKSEVPNETVQILLTGEDAEAYSKAAALTESHQQMDMLTALGELRSPGFFVSEAEKPIFDQAGEVIKAARAQNPVKEITFTLPSPQERTDMGTTPGWNPNNNPAASVPVQYCPNSPFLQIESSVPQLAPSDELPRAEKKGLNYADYAKLFLGRVPIKRDGEKTFRYDDGIYVAMSDGELNTCLLNYLGAEIGSVGAANMLKHIADYVKAMPDIQDTPITDPMLLCVRNGVLDLRHKRLLPHSPHHFFPHRIEADIILSAQTSCPAFEKFLRDITGQDQRLALCIWQVIGYILSTDTSAKKLFVLQGVSDSGKSVLGNLITSMFNIEAVSNLSIFQFEGQFATSTLNQKRLNICMDLPNKKLSAQAVGILKMLTGQDTIMVEEKYKAATTYKCCCKLIFGTNHPLNFDGSDVAFASRLLVIPFHFPVPKECQDHNLLQKLEREKSAIVMKALQAYLDLAATGYHFAAGTAFTEMQMTSQRIISAEQIIQQFLQAECFFDERAFTRTRDLHESYLRFCTSNGYPALADCNSFSRQLSACCGEGVSNHKQRVNGILENGYRGLGLR